MPEDPYPDLREKLKQKHQGAIPKRIWIDRERERTKVQKRAEELGHAFDEKGIRLKGCQFGGLRRIPQNPEIDPPRGMCFRCWEGNHKQFECPKRRDIPDNYCFNCGRYGRSLTTCERCSEAHARFLRKRAWDSRSSDGNHSQRVVVHQDLVTRNRSPKSLSSNHLEHGERRKSRREERRSANTSRRESSHACRRSPSTSPRSYSGKKASHGPSREGERRSRETPNSNSGLMTGRRSEIAPSTATSGAYEELCAQTQESQRVIVRVETPGVGVPSTSQLPVAPASYGVIPPNVLQSTNQLGTAPVLLGSPPFPMAVSPQLPMAVSLQLPMAVMGSSLNAVGLGPSGRGEAIDPVVQVMQQATQPGIPEEVRQTLYQYAKQLAEQRFGKY